MVIHCGKMYTQVTLLLSTSDLRTSNFNIIIALKIVSAHSLDRQNYCHLSVPIWNFFRFFWRHMLFIKLKCKSVKFCKSTHSKYMGKNRYCQRFYIFVRISPKNLKKFIVIYREKIYLYGFFRFFQEIGCGKENIS